MSNIGSTTYSSCAAGVIALVLGILSASALCAQTLFETLIERSDIISVTDESLFSAEMRSVAETSILLSNGSQQNLRDLYTPDFPEISLNWVTEVEKNLGIVWGIRTGEQAQQYSIDPAFKIGLLKLFPLSGQSQISVSVTTILGGRLTERPCTANYGVIGTKIVNCRLASSLLSPEDTLNYLFDWAPKDRSQVTARYTLLF